MKGTMKKSFKKLPNEMGTPLHYDKAPPRMGRSGGSGKGGNTWSIPNGAKYGLGESKQPTRMSRKGGKGKSGSGNSLPPSNGPARASRKDTGANSSMGKGYGCNGVSGGATGNYGGS